MAFTRRTFIQAATSALDAKALGLQARQRGQSESIRVCMTTAKTGQLAT